MLFAFFFFRFCLPPPLSLSLFLSTSRRGEELHCSFLFLFRFRFSLFFLFSVNLWAQIHKCPFERRCNVILFLFLFFFFFGSFLSNWFRWGGALLQDGRRRVRSLPHLLRRLDHDGPAPHREPQVRSPVRCFMPRKVDQNQKVVPSVLGGCAKGRHPAHFLRQHHRERYCRERPPEATVREDAKGTDRGRNREGCPAAAGHPVDSALRGL